MTDVHLQIQRLEFMHGRGVLHRDIQLGNCVLGLPPYDKVIYMIDFGFSKRYIDPYTNRHIPNSKAKRDFIGNYWFRSALLLWNSLIRSDVSFSSVNVHCRGKGTYDPIENRSWTIYRTFL